MRPLVTIAFIIVLPIWSLAQEEGLVSIEDRPLRWRDFKGSSKGEKWSAVTWTYTTHKEVATDNGKRWEVVSWFNSSRSWVRKEYLEKATDSASQELLKHEQGHYDISIVIASELENALNSFVYDHNERRKRFQADSIFNVYLKKQSKLQKLYDEKTAHSRNYIMQRAWNMRIKWALKRKAIKL